MTTLRFRSTVALLLVVAVRPATAQTDVKDGADHPLVGRFAGAIIRAYEAKDFDGYTVGLGRLSYRGNVNTFEWAKAEKIEGKVTRVTYLAPAAAASLGSGHAKNRTNPLTAGKNAVAHRFVHLGRMGFLFGQ